MKGAWYFTKSSSSGASELLLGQDLGSWQKRQEAEFRVALAPASRKPAISALINDHGLKYEGFNAYSLLQP